MSIFFLQISSIISGYRYFKQSDDGHLGIFKGISELFKNIIHTFSNNRCEVSLIYIKDKNIIIPSSFDYWFLFSWCLQYMVSNTSIYYITSIQSSFLKSEHIRKKRWLTMKNIKLIDWADIAKTLGVETNNDER